MDTDVNSVHDHVDSRKKSLSSRQCSLGELLYNALSCERKTNAPIKRRKERGVSHVLVLFTGGTVGMVKSEHNSYVTMPDVFEKYIRRIPYMHDEEYASAHLTGPDKGKFLVHPEVMDKTRILYHIKEYNPLLDSSNLGMDNWIRIGLDIKNSYEAYDGFVILHGTDTLAYTASALSFMFENLGKTVVITGSQIPVFESRSDGRDNILGALVIAANFIIPEVTVFFRNSLYRGNRTMKISTDALHAFNSPNMAPLAKFDINIEVDYKSIFRPHTIEKFNVHSILNPNVSLLRLFPNITIQAVRAYLQPPTEGIVLQTYGAGNIPSNRDDITQALKDATERGVLIVNCTQCIEGSVSAVYETGMVLSEAGVIPGSDMTPEAALTKLSYVLSKTEWDIETKRKMMQKNIRGELTYEEKEEGGMTLQEIWKVQDEAKLEQIMIPALCGTHIVEGNIEGLKALKQSGANFSLEDADFRTPLHVACCEGNDKIVEYLLLNGASVHAKDRFDNTPLMDAIQFDNHAIIKMLVKCGAHLALNQSKMIGEKLCSAAAKGDLKRLMSFQLAGATLNEPDFCDNTALHIAVLHGNKEIVSYLVKMKVRTEAKNMMGETPKDLAQRLNNRNILQLF